MRIAIISDTHIRKNINEFIDFVEKYIIDVDMVIHCGDYINRETIDILRKDNKFLGVFGNVDDDDIKSVLPEKRIIEVEGYRIGVFHGHGEKKATIDRAYDAFIEDDVDIIAFGHSHQPMVKTKNKVLMINPGSPRDKRKERWFTFVLLDINIGIIDVNIKFYP